MKQKAQWVTENESLKRLQKGYLTEIRFLRKRLGIRKPFKCICCGKEIDPLIKPCALVISPPDEHGNYDKDHLCCECYETWMWGGDAPADAEPKPPRA